MINKVTFLRLVSILEIFYQSYTIAAAATWKPAASLISDLSDNQVMVKVVENGTSNIKINYQVPDIEFQPVHYINKFGKDVLRCSMGNALQYSEPGEPEVPYISARIIIPYGYEISRVLISPDNVKKLSGSYLLSYGEIPHPLGSETITWAEPNRSIYESNDPFPGKTHEFRDIAYRCGVAIAYIDIFPLTYLPKSGAISFYKKFSLEIELTQGTLKRSTRSGTDIIARPDRLHKGKISEENPDALESYPRNVTRAENYRYLVVAPKSFINAGTKPNIQDLIKQREAQGFSCKVEPYENIGDAFKLRNFIKKCYNDHNTEFVLLVGDPGPKPIIPTFKIRIESSDLPSDLPYQCLDEKNWQKDYEAEVYIGRISAENPKEVSNQIYKILSYENQSGEYWTNGLSCGEMLDQRTYAKSAMQELEKYFDKPWKFDGLYDKDKKWDKNDILKKINSNRFSVINHLGHSFAYLNLKLRLNDESRFTNTNFMFLKTQGCIAGRFQADCIAERFTSQNRKGMFAGVFNSHNGYFKPGNPSNGSSHLVHRAFWKACWDEDLEYFGEFNEYSHRMNTKHRKDMVESNLFGCPAIKFRGRNIAPYIALQFPSGGEEIELKDTCIIKWHDNIDGNVKLELIKAGAVEKELAYNVESNGKFLWVVPENVSYGKDYKVKITSINDPKLSVASIHNFSINPEFIIKRYPYFESFDTLDTNSMVLPKKWKQMEGDDFDWTVWKGSTPSKVHPRGGTTGPDKDHTSGKGNYIYIEASIPNHPNKGADIITPKFDLRNLNDGVLSFWYHMFSDSNHIGGLQMDIHADGKIYKEVITLSNNDYKDRWIMQEIPLDKYRGERVQFCFRAKTGKSYAGDICIDDFKITGDMTGITPKVKRALPFDLFYANSKILYCIPENIKETVHIQIYTAQGRRVSYYKIKPDTKGYRSIQLNSNSSNAALSNGLYIGKMKTKGFSKTINFIILR